MVSGFRRDGYKTIWTVAFVLCLAEVSAPNRSVGSESQGPDSAKLKAAVYYVECTIAPSEASRVPEPLRQGESLSPQSVSALAVSPDGQQLAVTTTAFRHENNFWLLGEDGRVLWGRYLEPWAPGQVTFLPQGKRFAVGQKEDTRLISLVLTAR